MSWDRDWSKKCQKFRSLPLSYKLSWCKFYYNYFKTFDKDYVTVKNVVEFVSNYFETLCDKTRYEAWEMFSYFYKD